MTNVEVCDTIDCGGKGTSERSEQRKDKRAKKQCDQNGKEDAVDEITKIVKSLGENEK